MIDAIKIKLQLWKWRNLTIIGRIQIVKTLTEANRIIFGFIWKRKDKDKLK